MTKKLYTLSQIRGAYVAGLKAKRRIKLNWWFVTGVLIRAENKNTPIDELKRDIRNLVNILFDIEDGLR